MLKGTPRKKMDSGGPLIEEGNNNKIHEILEITLKKNENHFIEDTLGCLYVRMYV